MLSSAMRCGEPFVGALPLGGPLLPYPLLP
jgi:hypothetical protein